jgi:hypothetical protein
MAAAEKLLETVGLSRGLAQNGYNPFPPPGQVGKSRAGLGAFGPVSAGKLLKYPRVQKDCAQ